MLRLSEIKINIIKAADSESEKEALQSAILARLKIKERELLNYAVYRKSIDARNKSAIFYVYTVDVKLKNENLILDRFKTRGITITPDMNYREAKPGPEKMNNRPVIIGSGPAGLFAGLILARQGYQPLLLERGEDVDRRKASIQKFWETGRLNTESNVQFGEGGAGTFSDGKLTTRISDPRCRFVLAEFIKAGAPASILYDHKPHIGTDLLIATVKNIRREIQAHGGEVRFNTKVTDFIINNGAVSGVEVNNSGIIDCCTVLLAAGHSARDTYDVLYRRGVIMNSKAFSIGVRIEHPQAMIDEAQYGDYAGYPGLGAADYKMAFHNKDGRSAYTFCMCPGGYVVAAASEEGAVVTNGMSENKRDGDNANAALLVGVSPLDYPDQHPLAGIAFQRKWEHLAFELGGSNYKAPAQLTGNFLQGRISNNQGKVKATYRPGITFAPLTGCLPGYVVTTLQEAIRYFDQRLKGFAREDSLLTGVETRSSSPVRINRDENGLSNIAGLYPAGEGAGYAGGIMSSAVDGIKAAEKIILRYAP